jgi:hypothetical protein
MAGFHYDGRQLLKAENEYNKATLFPATLEEYKQVLHSIPPEKPAKHLPRGNGNTGTDSRAG